eukprot:3687980-Karenia_brevis.AAC.1
MAALKLITSMFMHVHVFVHVMRHHAAAAQPHRSLRSGAGTTLFVHVVISIPHVESALGL